MRPHQSGQEGLPRSAEGHHSSHPVQPDGHGGQDVRRDVRPLRHAAEFANVLEAEDVVHAVRSSRGQQ